jgi:hypothetical protein
MLEEKIRALALKEGTVRVKIARRESFADASPSTEMHYEKTWADMVISFAVDLGKPWIKDCQRRAPTDLLFHSRLIKQNQQGQEVVVGPHLKAQRGY